MAICNVFKGLSNPNGTFFTFSQYMEDLTKHQSDCEYKVIPSKFICCDVDYSNFDNKTLPTLIQNNFENGCSFLREAYDEWSPEISKNVFWNELSPLFLQNDKSNIVYIGDINIQSYSSKDNIGYNEIYCYIPNDAKEIGVDFSKNLQPAQSIEYPYNYIMGYDSVDTEFEGLLDLDTVLNVDKFESLNNYNYQFNAKYNINKVDVESNNSFNFNTVIVLYNIESKGNIIYSDIPLGIYLTGIIDNGVMTNSVTKYISNEDIYGAGTSYGLRICNRFIATQNGTSIKSDVDVSTNEDSIYTSMAEVMSTMVESQLKMNQVVDSIHDYHQDIKDHLAQFKNYRTNVPYVVYIDNVPYWFVNGKNTGVKIWYDIVTEDDGVVIVTAAGKGHDYKMNFRHKEYLDKPVVVSLEDDVVNVTEGKSCKVSIPKISVDKTGHIDGYATTELDINIGTKGYVYNEEKNSFAAGTKSIATGENSFAAGMYNKAEGLASHAEGIYNEARNEAQYVAGKYATIDETGTAIFQVGIGTDENDRRDAFRINNDGTFVFGDMNNVDEPTTYNMRMRKSAPRVAQNTAVLTVDDLRNVAQMDVKIANAIGEFEENLEFPSYEEEFNAINAALAESSRENVAALESLQEKIFDPDGGLTHDIVNTMMSQVGADSMNFQLYKTKTTLNSNGINTLQNAELTNNYFKVIENDTLAHFVYIEGEQKGTWEISGDFTQTLQPNKTYYICLKCHRNTSEGQWVCSETQYKTDENPNYWYFNWGIIIPDAEGNYKLTETRGCSYMYGDNLVCGKISSTAGNSYFDLNNGDFVLGNGTTQALQYIDGVLQIGGVNDGSVDSVMSRLGLIENDVTGINANISEVESAAIAAQARAEEAIKEAAEADERLSSWVQDGVFSPSEKQGLKDEMSRIIADYNHITGEYSKYNISDASNFVSNYESYWNELNNVISVLKTDPINIPDTFAKSQEDYYTSRSSALQSISTAADKKAEVYAAKVAKEEAEAKQAALREEFNEIVRNQEETLNKNLTNAIESVNGGLDNLQKQLDGEVTSWFFKGTPTMENEPVSNWKEEEYKNHVGDTYTDISEYINDEQTPTSGQSWRFCDCEYVDETTGETVSGYHWHKIADSDAVKALAEAAKAQSTADGKSTTFINKQPSNYRVGDLWILTEAVTHEDYTVGDILTANETSQVYDKLHWSKEIKYTDDSLAEEAKLDAANAQAEAEAAHTDAVNALKELSEVHSDGRVYKSEFKQLKLEKESIEQERNEIVGIDGKGGDASKWNIESVANNYFIVANKAIDALIYFSSEDNLDTKEDGSKLDYITINNELWNDITNYYSQRQIILNAIADASKEYSDNIDSKAEDAAEAANKAQTAAQTAAEEAELANSQLNAIGNDSLIGVTEFAVLETQLETIKAEYNDIIADATMYNVNVDDYNLAYNNACIALNYHCGKEYADGEKAPINSDKSITIVNDETKSYNYGNISAYYTARQTLLNNISKATKEYAESLQFELSPENINKILSNVKIGGVNIVKKSRNRSFTNWEGTNNITLGVEDEYSTTIINEESQLSMCNKLYDNTIDKNDLTDLEWSGNYVSASVDVFIPSNSVSIENANPEKANKLRLEVMFRNKQNDIVTDLYHTYSEFKDIKLGKWNRFDFSWKMDYSITDPITVDDNSYLTNLVYFVVNAGDHYKVGTEFKFRNLQIEFGTTATSWSPAPEDIDSGLEDAYSVAQEAIENANVAQEEANKSIAQLDAMADDSILSAQEKVSVKREWDEIQYEKTQNNNTNNQLWTINGYPDTTQYSNYVEAYNELSTYIAKLNLEDASNVELLKIGDEIIDDITYSGKDLFNKKFKDYYTANTAFLNVVAEQLAYMEVLKVEIGGTNLIVGSESLSITHKILRDDLEDNANYTISCKEIIKGTNSEYVRVTLQIPNGSYKRLADEWNGSPITFNTEGGYTIVHLYGGNPADTTQISTFKFIKLEKGTVATDWTPAPEDYANAIAASEERLGESIAKTMSNISDLQAQIDGEVNSWFLKGTPTIENEPVSNWSTDEYERHLGDTYTDISEVTLLPSSMWEQGSISYLGEDGLNKTYEEQKSTGSHRFRTKELLDNIPGSVVYVPTGYNICRMAYNEQGKYLGTYSDNNVDFTLTNTTSNGEVISKIALLVYKKNETSLPVSLADDLKLCLNPTAGQSWRWCNTNDEYGDGWHWHKIADSAATKALLEASKAQSVADGKSTTFVTQPSNYQVGDLWILQNDSDHSEGKKGEILTANKSNTSYNSLDWSKSVTYTDDTVAKQAINDAKAAKDAADSAQQEATAAANRLNSWASDSVISPVEKQGIKDEISRINADLQQITKNCTQYNLSNHANFTAFTTAHTNYLNLLNGIINSNLDTVPIPSNFATTQEAYYLTRTNILQTISETSQNVAENYAKEYSLDAISKMEIGGRNLLKNSKTLGIGAWTVANDFVRESDKNIITTKQAGVWDAYVSIRNILTDYSWKDKNITFSVQVKPSEDMQKVKIGIVIRLGNNTSVSDNYYANPNIMSLKGGEWNTLYSTYKPVVDTEQLYNENYSFYLVIRCDDNNVSSGSVINLKDWKIEFGNKATDWTPAPEDVEAEIADAKNDAANAQAVAQAATDKLSAWSADGVITHFEVQGIKDELASIKADYDEINTDYTKYGLGTPINFNEKYNTYKGQLDTLSKATADAPVNIPDTFATNQTNYYAARTTAYNNISTGVNAYANSVAQQQAQSAVNNLEIGVRNLWAKKYMMDWNNTYAGTATKGSDEYGEYIAVHETNLYEYIGDRTAYEDILQGNVKFEEGKQYCLKVKWRTPVVQSYGGLRLFFKYSDGTNGYDTNSSIQCPMSTTQTVNTLISEKGKTVTGVCCTYGALNNARIYEIQLVQATKQPNDWLVAPEDIDNEVAIARQEAEEAKQDATKALGELSEVHSDNRVYKSEFKQLRLELESIIQERNEIVGVDGTGGDASKWDAVLDSGIAENYFKAATKAIAALSYYSNEDNLDTTQDGDVYCVEFALDTISNDVLTLIEDGSNVDDFMDPELGYVGGDFRNSWFVWEPGSEMDWDGSTYQLFEESSDSDLYLTDDIWILSVGSSVTDNGYFCITNSSGNFEEYENTTTIKELKIYTTESSTLDYITIDKVFNDDDEPLWNDITNYYSQRQIILNAIADASKEYSDNIDSKAIAAAEAADLAQDAADASLSQLSDMSNDNILTPQEKGSVADEWVCIQKEYTQNSTNKTAIWGSATVAEWTAYNTAYTTLQTYVGNLKLTDRENNTTIVKSDFQTKFANYYSANVAFLNALSKKVAEIEVDNLEIGGRNLLAREYQLVNTNSNITSVYNTNDEIPIPARGNLTYVDLAYVTPIIPNGTEYILTFEAKANKANAKINSHWYNPNTTISSANNQGYTLTGKDGSSLFTLTTEWKKYWVKWKQSETTTTKNCIVARNLISQNGTDCIVYVRNVKLEQGNKATSWSPAPEDTLAQIEEVRSYTDSLTKTLGDSLQKQIDGVVDSYFMEGEPTTSNAPANEWTTDDLKKRHEGDTYTSISEYPDPSAGKSWRWCQGNTTGDNVGWHWHPIADSDAVKALQEAAAAKDTADKKRRVFTAQPSGPYDKGDLWIKAVGSGMDTLYCKTARTTTGFSASEWESSTVAQNAATAAAAAQSTANTAQSTANAAGTAASKAQSTANSAQSAATAAQQAAAEAKKMAQDEATATQHLKTVLTKGTTDISGGLVLTNVLALKNIDGVVTAGLSGLTSTGTGPCHPEDNVLLWGGGTYQEAYTAANNDYKIDTAGNQITTLIKKDGTGKIGIFEIDEDSTIIHGEDSSYLDMNSEGITFYDSNGDVVTDINYGGISSKDPSSGAGVLLTQGQFLMNSFDRNCTVRFVPAAGGIISFSKNGNDWDNMISTGIHINSPLSGSGGRITLNYDENSNGENIYSYTIDIDKYGIYIYNMDEHFYFQLDNDGIKIGNYKNTGFILDSNGIKLVGIPDSSNAKTGYLCKINSSGAIGIK